MVNDGETLTFTVAGTTGAYLPRSVDSVRQIVIDNLTSSFDVEDVSFTTESLLSDPLHYLSNWSYQASVRVVTRSAYADIRDVDNIIAHAFYEGTGELPTVTADDYEEGQGASDRKAGGPSLTFMLVLVVVALVAIAVIKAE